ncbi:endothelin-converting enzyme homolog [Haemaphysalis longicornis]
MLVQLNRSLEATNRTFPFWIKIKDLGAYSVDAISSQRWLHVIRGRTNPSSDDDDDMYARPLALSLLSRLMTGDPSTARTLLWWGVVRELAPYASGRFLPTDARQLNNFCVQRVAAEAELAIMAVHLFRAVSPSTTSAARAMAQRIQSALVSTLRSAPWLRGRTRAVAVRKASAMRLAVGFPPSLENEAKLDAYFAALADLRPDRSLASWLALRRFLQRKGGLNYDLAMTHAHKVNAYYAPGNTVVLPAGIIQEPVYFDDAAHAYNYGSLGQALGHEMTHAYDKNGRDWDDRGKRWNWWSRSSMASYEDRLKCIRTSHVEVERALRHWEDGAKQDPENLADFGGAYVAYRAFRDLSPDQRCFSVAGFSSEQLFFIGHCVKWCRPLNVHRNQNYARGLLRCIVPLMHMPQFSDAFGCRRHDHMNPARKCSFWL